jgi:hypothetical protein
VIPDEDIRANGVSLHALQRFRIHHAAAVLSEVLAAIEQGYEVTPELAAHLAGRRVPDLTCRYFVTADCWGMFVVRNGHAITYLRWQRTQRDLCRTWWPEEPTPAQRCADVPTVTVIPQPTLQSWSRPHGPKWLDPPRVACFACGEIWRVTPQLAGRAHEGCPTCGFDGSPTKLAQVLANAWKAA